MIVNSLLLFLAHVVARLNQLYQSESSHTLPSLLFETSFHCGLHSDFVFLAVQSQDFLDLAQAQMESLCDKTEERVGQDERE